MGETPRELVQQIEAARSHLEEDLSALERRVKQQTAMQLRFWRHPLVLVGAVAVAGVFLLGFVVGRMTRRS